MRSLEKLINFFGSDESKENFLHLCLKYKGAYFESLEAQIADRGSYTPRATTHNKLMETIDHLYMQHPTIKTEFGDHPDRVEPREMILDANPELLGENSKAQ